MIDERELLERELERFTPDPGILERITLRRERKQRLHRLTAGALGVAITVSVIAAVVTVTTLRSQRPAPGDVSIAPSPVVSPPPPELSTAPDGYLRLPPRPPAVTVPEPLVELNSGYHFVDVRTGEATRMPESIMAVEGAGNFEVSPDGSMILFDNASITTPSNEPAELGHHQLYVANIDGSDLRQLTNDPVGASQGSWSPDGTKVVYLGGWAKLCCGKHEADLTVLDLDSGTATVLVHGSAFDFYTPFFSEDGSILFTRWGNSGRDDLWMIPADGGEPELFLEDRGWADVSPDGTSLAYQWIETWREGNCGSDFGVAWISSADGSDPRLFAPKALADRRGTGVGAGWSPDGTRIAYTEDLVPPEGCDSPAPVYGVYLMDMETGERTLVAFGWGIDWLDDRSVLIKAQPRGDELG